MSLPRDERAAHLGGAPAPSRRSATFAPSSTSAAGADPVRRRSLRGRPRPARLSLAATEPASSPDHGRDRFVRARSLRRRTLPPPRRGAVTPVLKSIASLCRFFLASPPADPYALIVETRHEARFRVSARSVSPSAKAERAWKAARAPGSPSSTRSSTPDVQPPTAAESARLAALEAEYKRSRRRRATSRPPGTLTSICGRDPRSSRARCARRRGRRVGRDEGDLRRREGQGSPSTATSLNYNPTRDPSPRTSIGYHVGGGVGGSFGAGSG